MIYPAAPPPDHSRLNGGARLLAVVVFGFISLIGIGMAALVAAMPIHAMMKAAACDCAVPGAAMDLKTGAILIGVEAGLLFPAVFTVSMVLMNRKGASGAGARLGRTLFAGCAMLLGLFMLVAGPMRAFDGARNGAMETPKSGVVRLENRPVRFGLEMFLWGVAMPLIGAAIVAFAGKQLRRGSGPDDANQRLARRIAGQAGLDNAVRRPLDPRD